MLLFAAIALVFGALIILLSKGEQHWLWQELALLALAAPGYGALYLSAPIVLARLGTADPSHTPRVTRVAALGLFVVGSGAPPLIAALAGREADGKAINFLNPVLGLINLRHESGIPVLQVLVLWCIALLLVVIAHEMLVRRDNAALDPGRVG
jgi:hypothetical protein